MHLGGADRVPAARVEQHDIRVRADRQRALPTFVESRP
jgi:hypothetical protein